MEIFKDIKGYEGFYQVSNLGNVKSLVRKGRKKEMILRPKKKRDGHYSVSLSNNSIKKHLDVHQLVAIAFLNHNPNGHTIEVDHINNNPLDNRVENLQLLTNREHKSKHIKGVSTYVGVYFKKERNKWGSCIRINKKLIHLGYYEIEVEASRMYQLSLNNIDKYKGNNKFFREYLVNLC
jgi:hypothetical protein